MRSIIDRNVVMRRIPVEVTGNERFYMWPNPDVIGILISLSISHWLPYYCAWLY